MNCDPSEMESLKLLAEMQAELRGALNDLGGKWGDGLVERYAFYTAANINRAVEGYVYLRESRRIDASKLLVRTGIEAMIRLRCVRAHPELLFRLAFTEFDEDKKWARSAKNPDQANSIRAIESEWDAFVKSYQNKYPQHPLTAEVLTLWEAAKHAGLQDYYDTHYRLYCRFTHAALRASIGGLNSFDAEDDRTMIVSALAAVEALVSLGAAAPNLADLRKRFSLM
jgi:hypothetical protein